MKHYSTYQSQFIEMFNEKGYPLTMIKSFADVSTGGTPSKANPEYWNGDKPWVSAEDMKNKYVYDTLEKVTEAGYATCKIIPVDTLMYVCRGSIGVMAINKIECATNQSICRAKCHDNVCNVEFLYHALMYQRDNIKKMGTGTSFKSLNQTSFSELKIELPPYNEQMKFVSIAHQADKSKFTSLKSQFIEMFGDTHMRSDYSRQWKEVVEIINGKDYKSIQVEDGGYPVYGTGGEMARVSDYISPANSILLGRKGTIDKPLLIREKYWNVDTAFGAVPDEKVLHYVYFYWHCKTIDFNVLNKGTTLPSTTKVDLLNLWIKIPSMEEQTRFASIVEQADKSKYMN